MSQGEVAPLREAIPLGEVEPLACGSVDTLGYGEYAVLETPNFPNKRYPNNFSCEWDLNFPAGAQLFLSCDYFWVKKGDYFSVGGQEYYGYSSAFQGRPLELLDTALSLSLSFTTNKRGRAWGFRCFVDVEAGNLTTTTSSPETPSVSTAPGTCTCGQTNTANRIVGGEETEAHEYPWQVALVHSTGSRPFCGGTLISSQHVLTAAHCTAGRSASSLAVLVGEHRIDDSSFTRVSLSAITDHPQYNSADIDNDFSILTLSSPVAFTREVSPACLPGDVTATFEGLQATVSGWGRTSSGGNQPTTLRDTQVTVLSQEECRAFWGGIITSNKICAFNTNDLDNGSCNGDSGGPLVVQDPVKGRFALAGVVSFGSQGCTHGVYARVTAQMDWILANTQGTQDTNQC